MQLQNMQVKTESNKQHNWQDNYSKLKALNKTNNKSNQRPTKPAQNQNTL